MTRTFKVKLILRGIINFINRLFRVDDRAKFSPSTLRFVEEAVENIYGVDRDVAQHGHDEVRLKRFFVMFLLDKTGWSVMELHRQLERADIKAKGLSRRSLQYYVNTFNEQLEDENIGKVMDIRQDYLTFCKKLNSIL